MASPEASLCATASLCYGMRADPVALRGRAMAWHRARHLMAANGRGWRADCGEFVWCAKIFSIGENAICRNLELAINRASFINGESSEQLAEKNTPHL